MLNFSCKILHLNKVTKLFTTLHIYWVISFTNITNFSYRYVYAIKILIITYSLSSIEKHINVIYINSNYN